jgi:phosphoribosylamine--glycine ligase
MNILVIGSGGREHALVWKINQSSKVKKVYVAPGNAGTYAIAENVDIKADDLEGLLAFAKKKSIDLTVVGPEVPLSLGIVDLFEENGLKIFGPNKASAKIEASKSFAKDLMKKYNIPTAKYEVFSDFSKAKNYLERISFPQVIKADGLAAGKGVLIVNDYSEAMEALTVIMKDEKFGQAGSEVVIEEFLDGHEISLLAFADGKTIIPMDTAQDHKKIFEGNKGPNTGGMGAYSPSKLISQDDLNFAIDKVLKKTFNALKEEGITYKGVLYAGLMLTKEGPKVLEFNCRFGDPETQVLLPRLETDLVDIMESCIAGNLNDIDIRWSDNYAICVVLASKGYPNSYQKGYEIKGIEKAELVFHAGTKISDGNILTNGGRVLGVMGINQKVYQALAQVYKDVETIEFEGKYYRNDIAKEAL